MAIAAAAPVAPTRSSSGSTDHELVAAVRAGDDRAFEELYTRYRRRITSYIQGMVQDHARAEDITQDVFVAALRRMRQTERPIAFKPWIYEIAKNACIDQFRRSRRAEEVSYDADGAGLAPADHGRLTSRGPSPDLAVEHKQQLDHLRGAFGGLSEAHHEILVMREFEGLSYREIGERLGMSRPSVESTLFRARRRLTEEYEELVTGERCLRVQAIVREAGTGALGVRDRRRVSRHISHCQPCRRQARMAGLDTGASAERSVRARLAALLPMPAVLRRRGDGDDAGLSGTLAASAHPLATWSSTVAHYVEPGIAGWAKAAAAAATIAVAGTGVNAGMGEAPVDPAHHHSHPAVLLLAQDERRTPAPAPAAQPPQVQPETPAPTSAPQGGPAAAEREAAGTATGSRGATSTRPAGSGVPSVPAPPSVPETGLRDLLEPPPAANPVPRPQSGGTRGLDPKELLPKGATPASVPVADPVALPDVIENEVDGAAQRVQQGVTDVLGG